MKDTWFWRVLAVLALLVTLGFVVSRFTAAPTVRAGGEGGYIMEVVSDNVQSGRVFLLDTNRKVLIMYGSPARMVFSSGGEAVDGRPGSPTPPVALPRRTGGG